MRTDVMQNVHEGAAVFRICASTHNTWEVFQGTNAQPLASFDDKNAALTYALCLARGKVSWQSLLESGVRNARDNAIVGYSRHS
jgi:hypothetical protein